MQECVCVRERVAEGEDKQTERKKLKEREKVCERQTDMSLNGSVTFNMGKGKCLKL